MAVPQQVVAPPLEAAPLLEAGPLLEVVVPLPPWAVVSPPVLVEVLPLLGSAPEALPLSEVPLRLWGFRQTTRRVSLLRKVSRLE